MNPSIILSLLCLYTGWVYSAPVHTDEVEFLHTVELGKSLIKKILSDIPEVHRSCVSVQGLTLDSAAAVKNLQFIVTVLGIPSAPTLKAHSADYTVDMSLSHIAEGLQLHWHLLEALKKHLPPSDKLTGLLADIKDLQAQVQKMPTPMLSIASAGDLHPAASGFSSRLTDDYLVQVATHLALKQLQNFAQDVFRSLRHIGRP